MMKKISLICILTLIISVFPQRIMAQCMGRVYYVSNDGDDLNDGSMDMPFRTISYAAGVMQAGDVCYVRGGVYRETVQIRNKGTKEKNIVFKAYNNESVTISGADVLEGSWHKYKDNIYYTHMDWSMNDGNSNMIFADGIMQQEARWPNIGDSLDPNQYARPDAFSQGYLTDADIPNVDLNDSLIWFRTDKGYWSFTGRVLSNSPGKIKISYEPAYPPDNTSIYYLARNLNLLDTAGEWYLDEKANRLYFWAPGDVNPEKLEVSAQKRKNAIIFSGARYVTVDGFNITGGNIEFSDDTENCALNGLSVKYPSYTVTLPENGTGGCSSEGILLNGKKNTIKNSEIANAYGDAVEINGSYNTVLNCDIHDFNYENTYSYGVNINGDHHLVKNNSIYHTGRSAIGGMFEASEICYNDISDTMKISKDGGAIYLVEHDFENSEIHHNIFSDQQNEGFGAAMYYDSGCSRIVSYNNVIITGDNENDVLALCVNNPSEYNLFFNNTFVGKAPVHFAGKTEGMAGSVYVNNLFTAKPFEENASSIYGFYEMNNATVDKSDLNEDATLKSTSAAIDAGVVLSGMMQEYSSAAPDCGAYENGLIKWTAGCDKSKDMNGEINMSLTIPFENVMNNCSYEDDTDGWEIQKGTPRIINQNAWSNPQYVREGKKSLEIKTGDFVKKTITGLVPNETYVLQWYSKTDGMFVRATDYDEVSEPFVTATAVSSEVLTNMKTGQWIKYKNVDFGAGEYDSVIYTNYHGSYVHNNMDMYIDGLDDCVASGQVYAIASWYEYTHKLSKTVTGVHDVYIRFSQVSANDVLFAGFALYDSDAEDKTEVVAISDAHDRKEASFNTDSWGRLPQSLEITTGDLGEITIYIRKSEGANSTYFDSWGLSQKVSVNAKKADVYIESVKLKNMNNIPIIELNKSDLNIFEANMINPQQSDASYDVEYVCFDKDKAIFSKVEAAYDFAPKERKTIGLGTFSSGNGAYADIKIKQNDNVLAHYEITPITIFNANSFSDKDLKIENAWISNDLGTQKMETEVNNEIYLDFSNQANVALSVKCFVAMYDENMKLVSVRSEPKVFGAYESACINLNLGEKKHNELYAKIMVFKDDTIIPMTDLFKIY